MTVETATTFATLQPLWPLHADPLSEADGHIRLIKSLLATTFPSIAAPVSCSDVDLNALHAALANLSALSITTTGLSTQVAANTNAISSFASALNLNVAQLTGSITAANEVIAVMVPLGTITLLPSGATPGANWAVCNGSNGTVNLTSVTPAGTQYVQRIS